LCDEKQKGKKRKKWPKKKLLQQATRRDKAPKTPVAEQNSQWDYYCSASRPNQTGPDQTWPDLTGLDCNEVGEGWGLVLRTSNYPNCGDRHGPAIPNNIFSIKENPYLLLLLISIASSF
jgi:hypothetical protein